MDIGKTKSIKDRILVNNHGDFKSIGYDILNLS